MAAIAASALFAACGSDDDGDNNSAGGNINGDSTFSTQNLGGTPGNDTPSSGTPGSSSSPGTSGSPGTNPIPQNTLSPAEATAAAGDIAGGPEDATPAIVSTIPAVTPAAGVTPVIDPTEIAPPDPGVSDVRMIVDMDASQAGIQASRDVNRGDTFRVAIVVTNVPPPTGGGEGGLNAFQFDLNYDKTKIVAPSYFGGPDIDRNPDLNQPTLGEASNWTCLPAPEGDRDDAGGAEGDFDPATGQAILSCFAGIGGQAGQASGTIVVATVTFQAIASGSTTLSLSNMVMGDALGTEIGSCGDAGGENPVPCVSADANVR
jgi:hypothetical protein